VSDRLSPVEQDHGFCCHVGINLVGGEKAMSEAIIVAAISLTGTIITVWAANKHTLAELEKKSELSDAKLDAKLEKHQAVTDTKIDELTRKVEKHNNIIERTYKLEGRVTELEHDVRDMKGVQHAE